MPGPSGPSGNFLRREPLVDAIRRRPRLYRVARRLARTPGPPRLARARLLRPAVSVIVPIYNVEEYLADVPRLDPRGPDLPRLRGACSSTTARPTARARSPSSTPAATAASASSPVRTAGWARPATPASAPPAASSSPSSTPTTCCRRTRSRLLAPRRGHHRLGDRRRRRGAVRLRSATWTPSWVRRRPRSSRADGIDGGGPPPAAAQPLHLRTSSSGATSGCAQDLWFREGVAYEDQPIVTQLFARARSIDVVPDVVYRYRARDDRARSASRPRPSRTSATGSRPGG